MASSDDARVLAALRTLLDRAHLASPGQVPDVLALAGRELGWEVLLHLVDHEQRVLLPVPAAGAEATRPQTIDTTLAGRCFRDVEPVKWSGVGQGVWLPVLDGTDRLGVLKVTVADPAELDDPGFGDRCRLFAHLSGHLITAKSHYGDALTRVQRRQHRTVASELLWQLLPPLTFACEGLVVAGVLQPAYAVAADAFDYSVVDDVAHLALFDATGHDLAGTLLAAVALSTYRNRRREGVGLRGTAVEIDRYVAEQGGGEKFVTGVLGQLHLRTGRFRYLNAGHLAPLVMRRGKVVKELTGGHRVLFGLPGVEDPVELRVGEEVLEPDDWVVLHTDGIVEARGADGELFGLERLTDHLERSASAARPAPETVRRIVHAVLAHQGGVLQDDASLLVAQWAGGAERRMQSGWTGAVEPQQLAPPHPPGDEPLRR
ncbi:PP2C family protein-serine/threonine phosphatase [Kineococcus sp. SYSU DK005]|uniref:PP2C family protein-serine/threonine phosphatase n=1 Tax=Kineococcus sp. SYSU DK005 TaxID=3383126 RepID=UPI003D7E50A5